MNDTQARRLIIVWGVISVAACLGVAMAAGILGPHLRLFGPPILIMGVLRWRLRRWAWYAQFFVGCLVLAVYLLLYILL